VRLKPPHPKSKTLRARTSPPSFSLLDRCVQTMSTIKKIGLIVNPVAGLGGRVGLKGSDGPEIQLQARRLGAVPQASNRAMQVLETLRPLKDNIEIITCPDEMGEVAVRASGFAPIVQGSITPGKTTPADTQNAARQMLQQNICLLLFAGGDGTARDIYQAVGTALPALGIPAGVKIHSAVYAANPRSAGELVQLFLQGKIARLHEAEVMDLDETAYRQGNVSAQLYGYLKIPFQRRLVQNLKSASPPGEKAIAAAIACDVVDKMTTDCLYIIGPGTTTRAITDQLGLPKTLIGVDVILENKVVIPDVNETQLLELLSVEQEAKIIVTPIGGQGYIFGRGNQQISPQVISRVGKENIIVVSTPDKINSLRGNPLMVDTGDPTLDKMFTNHIKVITGYHQQIIYRVAS